jgi:hypothetical protein
VMLPLALTDIWSRCSEWRFVVDTQWRTGVSGRTNEHDHDKEKLIYARASEDS